MTRYDRERDDAFKFEIVQHLGVIGKYSTGWQKEINMVSWRGGQPKLDIRDWDENHERMSRGVTLHREEAVTLLRLLLKNYGNDLKQGSGAKKEKEEQESDDDCTLSEAAAE